MTFEVTFCKCGRVMVSDLNGSLACPKCKDKKTVEREKIGRHSGRSDTPYGSYEKR